MVILIKSQGDEYAWGAILGMLEPKDRRPAAVQFNEKYLGGWSPFPKDNLRFTNRAYPRLQYEGDPPLRWLSTLLFHRERLHLFQGSWIVIEQLDKSWETARMD